MKQLQLKYGCNPNQKPAQIFMRDGADIPFEILNGSLGFINLLDALNGWQLVKELKNATNMPCAASFKHVSPTSAAVGKKLSDTLKKAYFVQDIEGLDESPLACAYARARGADRLCSFGDFAALSDECDVVTAKILKREVGDGVIAPDFSPEALELLKQKKGGKYLIIKIDKDFVPHQTETKEVFGVTLEQARNNVVLDESVLNNIVSQNKTLPDFAKTDLLVAMITLKYTQSNSVCFAYDGQAIGVGAGQQSRIHCTRLAASKADLWKLRQHPRVLGLPFLPSISRAERDNAIDVFLGDTPQDVLAEGIWQRFFSELPQVLSTEEKTAHLNEFKGLSLASDAFFPFGDNIERARRSGVYFVVEAGGSVRDDDVIATCDKYGMVLIFNGIRLFHH